MSTLSRCPLLVLITEAVIEDTLTDELMSLGAHGYTVTDVRGRGSHGERGGAWSADRSIRIEVLCDAATADRIIEHVHARYFAHYAMVLWQTEVGVLRPAKFDG